MSRAPLDPDRAAQLLRDLGHDEELIGGRYALGVELGRGGMGVVHVAFDTELERDVALKLLTTGAGLAPAARARFAREAKLAARLGHPHIAAVYDATPDWIAMQWIRGPSLADYDPASHDELARLVRDAALGVHFAHESGVVHRDLKPSNLLVEPGEVPRVVVTDFGLGAELGLSGDASLSGLGAILGTPGFLSPEQAAGDRPGLGPATDVWGLGATLFAKLAGRPPFAPDPLLQHLRDVAERAAPDVRRFTPATPVDLAHIAARCLETSPQRRYPSALALASDLDRFLRREPVLAQPPTLLYRLRRLAVRRRAVFASAGLTATLTLAVGVPMLVGAHVRGAVAENQRRTLTEVLALDGRIRSSLGAAAAARAAGSGAERAAPGLLRASLAEVRTFLGAQDLPHVRMLEGRLLHALGSDLEALAAFDAAAPPANGRPEHLPGLELERGLTLAALYRQHLPILREPPHPQLELWRSRGASELGNALDEAADPARTPRRSYAHAMHAWLAGDLPRARDAAREALEMDVGHRDAHLALARIYPLLERPELGMRHSVIATDLMRGRRPTYAAAAAVAGAKGQPLDALHEPLELTGIAELGVDFHLELQLGPSEHASRGLRAQASLRRAAEALGTGDLPETHRFLNAARAELDGAIAMDPSRANLWLTRGLTHALLARQLEPGQLDAHHANLALTDYGRALELDPELVPARYNRALLQLERARLATDMRRPAEAFRWRTQAEADLERCASQTLGSPVWSPRLAAASAD